MQDIWIDADPHFQPNEGAFYDVNDEYQVFRPNTFSDHIRILRRDQPMRPLAIIQRHAIPLELCTLAVNSYLSVGKSVSTNRGIAAGQSHRNRSNTSRYEKGRAIQSGIMGYMDSTHHARPCRLTAFSQHHFEQYQQGLPFLYAIDRCFASAVPDAYEKQRTEAQKTEYHISNTAFSTITVNYNFRTALHRDHGDFKQGFGNLVLCTKDISGGWLLFPRYKVAIELQTGDFLAMDVHEWHANSPLDLHHSDSYRLSFVCYLRSRMSRCQEAEKRVQADLRDIPDVCRRIFATNGEILPERRDIGIGKDGIVWWEYEGERWKLEYKHKRYRLIDKKENRVIHNLYPALKYASEASAP